MKTHLNILRIDFWVQAFLMTLNTLLLFFLPYSFVFVLYLLLYIGFYQFLISAIVNLLREIVSPEIYKLRKIHFFGSIIFIGLLFLLGALELTQNWFYFFLLFIFPQLIAYAYFYLTWKEYSAYSTYLNSRPTNFA